MKKGEKNNNKFKKNNINNNMRSWKVFIDNGRVICREEEMKPSNPTNFAIKYRTPSLCASRFPIYYYHPLTFTQSVVLCGF